MPESIILTPQGLTTKEGIQRNKKAIDALYDANAKLCNMLIESMTSARSLEDSLRKLGLDKDEVADVVAAYDKRKDATEEFLRSLTGAPSVLNRPAHV